MELMSSLLFYAFVVMLPQALGKSRNFNSKLLLDTNDLSFLQNHAHFIQKKLLLNMNGASLVRKSYEKDTVFTDAECMKCRTCMKMAIKEYIHSKKHIELKPSPFDMHHELIASSNNSIFPLVNRPDRDRHVKDSSNLTQSDKKSNNYTVQELKSQEKLNSVYQSGEQNNTSSKEVENEGLTTQSTFQEKLLNSTKGVDKNDSEVNIRQKRDVLQNITDEEKQYRKNNKFDMKKVERLPNAITVTKYNLNGKTYALKVKETIKDSKLNENNESSCNVFKVVHTYACGSKDADSLLSSAKSRKKPKKKLNSKIIDERSIPVTTTAAPTTTTTPITTTTPTTTTPVASSTKKVTYLKRDIISQISKENYNMPSIEDIY